jgi:hypothetical protein
METKKAKWCQVDANYDCYGIKNLCIKAIHRATAQI